MGFQDRVEACDESVCFLICDRVVGGCVESFNNKLLDQIMLLICTELIIYMIYRSLYLLIQLPLSANKLSHVRPSKQVFSIFFKRLVRVQVKLIISCKVQHICLLIAQNRHRDWVFSFSKTYKFFKLRLPRDLICEQRVNRNLFLVHDC